MIEKEKEILEQLQKEDEGYSKKQYLETIALYRLMVAGYKKYPTEFKPIDYDYEELEKRLVFFDEIPTTEKKYEIAKFLRLVYEVKEKEKKAIKQANDAKNKLISKKYKIIDEALKLITNDFYAYGYDVNDDDKFNNVAALASFYHQHGFTYDDLITTKNTLSKMLIAIKNTKIVIEKNNKVTIEKWLKVINKKYNLKEYGSIQDLVDKI